MAGKGPKRDECGWYQPQFTALHTSVYSRYSEHYTDVCPPGLKFTGPGEHLCWERLRVLLLLLLLLLPMWMVLTAPLLIEREREREGAGVI